MSLELNPMLRSETFCRYRVQQPAMRHAAPIIYNSARTLICMKNHGLLYEHQALCSSLNGKPFVNNVR